MPTTIWGHRRRLVERILREHLDRGVCSGCPWVPSEGEDHTDHLAELIATATAVPGEADPLSSVPPGVRKYRDGGAIPGPPTSVRLTPLNDTADGGTLVSINGGPPTRVYTADEVRSAGAGGVLRLLDDGTIVQERPIGEEGDA